MLAGERPVDIVLIPLSSQAQTELNIRAEYVLAVRLEFMFDVEVALRHEAIETTSVDFFNGSALLHLEVITWLVWSRWYARFDISGLVHVIRAPGSDIGKTPPRQLNALDETGIW